MTDLATIDESFGMMDETNPRSLVNLVTENIAEALKDAIRAIPDFFGIDEREVYQKLRANGTPPSPTDNMLRLRFWYEYDQAQTNLTPKMGVGKVFAGVCTDLTYARLWKNPYKVAWMVCPPVGYNTKLDEILDFGMDRMRDIMAMDPHCPKTGKLNARILELQAKLFVMMDQRKHGVATQKIEQRSLNMHVTQAATHGLRAEMLQTGDEKLEEKLKELEARERRALNLVETHRQRELAGELIDESSGE